MAIGPTPHWPPCSVPADAQRDKESPGVPGLQVVSNKGEWPRGNEPLAAPILSQGTNQARRGSRKRPTRRSRRRDEPGLATAVSDSHSQGQSHSHSHSHSQGQSYSRPN
jgi:hypothetical protein